MTTSDHKKMALCRAWRVLRIAALSLMVFIAACAGKDATPAHAGFNRTSVERLFAVGYQDIKEIYIQEIGLRTLALTGLSQLESIDPALDLRHTQRTLTLRYRNSRRSFALPRTKDGNDWANLTADVLQTARGYSKAVMDTGMSQVYKTVFDGIMARLDRFSRYASAEKAQENRAQRDGFGGIGVRVKRRQKGIEILDVMESSPAARAGLHQGDMIVAVNGHPATQLAKGGTTALRGPIDSKVRLTVERAADDTAIRMAIKRARIVPQTVSYSRRKGTLYLRINGFNQRTADAVRKAIERAKSEMGPDLVGYILDLRNNPGGLLDQAVAVSDVFLAKGRVVSTRGRHPDSHQYFDAQPGDGAEARPVAVLVNTNSASAAEIVAAAIQDSGRGLVLGSTSYGKGTVQTVLRLPNDGELTLTWARFHAPSGYALSHRGVVPNVCTSLIESGTVDTLLTAVRHGKLAPHEKQPPTAAGDEAGTSAQESHQACPANGETTTETVALAEHLLNHSDLYRAARNGEPARVARAYTDRQ